MNWKLTKDFHLKIYKLWKIYLCTLNYEKEEEKSQNARLLHRLWSIRILTKLN